MNIDDYIEVAKTVAIGDPFDWADTPIDEESSYRLVAMSVLALNLEKDVAIAAVIKLCVENLVLNMRLLKERENIS